MSNERIYYDDAEYTAWLAGGPAPTPRRYTEERSNADMAVKASNIGGAHDDGKGRGARSRNPAALFRRGTFTGQQTGVRRFLAVLLALISLAGAVIWGGGGPGAWGAFAPIWWGVVGAVLLQLVLTYGQWVFGGPGWWNPLYLICWGLSTLTTVLGYWPLVHSWLTGQIRVFAGGEGILHYYAPWLAGAIIVVVAAGLDWLPEQTLLD